MGGGFSTASLCTRDRFDGWAAEVARQFGARSTTEGRREDFTGMIDTRLVGKFAVSEIIASPLSVARTDRDVSRVEMDLFTLGVLVEGSGVIAQKGREARFGAGDLILADCRSPYQIRFDTPFRQLVLSFERGHLVARLPQAEQRTAIRVDGRIGPGRVAFACLDAVREQAPHLGITVEAFGECALDLVALAFGGDPMMGTASDGGERLLLDRVKAFIEAHLASPQLTPDFIARRHGISRRYLYGLFEAERETVSGYIWRRRLDRCRDELTDARRLDRNISEIAFKWGFNDASHFCRAFRRAFGVSPRNFRLAHARNS